jgi:hypothetical protein
MSERIQVEVEGQSDHVRKRGGGLLGVAFLVPGLGLIGFGVALIVWPSLLIYLVAGVFMLMGVGLLIAGRKVNRARTQAAEFKARFTGFGGFGGFGGEPPSEP